MIGQRIILPGDSWEILLFYWVGEDDEDEVIDRLLSYGCPIDSAESSAQIVANRLNTGLTFSNTDEKVSLVCVSNVTSLPQMVSTIMHEIKHVLSHICEHYEVEEDSEPASYLVGYLAKLAYKFVSRFI